MKYLVVVLIALAALVAADDEWKPLEKPEIKKAHEDCQSEIGGDLDKKSAEMDLCMVKKMGIFSEDKGYDLERTLAQTKVVFGEVDGAREIIEGCLDSNENKDPAADWAFRVEQCISKSKLGDLKKASEID